MSENLELVRRSYDYFARTGELRLERFSPDFVWDMSQFGGWPERQIYEGVEGARAFLRNWSEAWDEWAIEVESLHDGGDEIVAVMHQTGQSKTSGAHVEMRFAQVWTVQDGKFIRMKMYADLGEALRSVSLKTG